MQTMIWFHLVDRELLSYYLSKSLILFKWPRLYLNQSIIPKTNLNHKPNHQNKIPLTIYFQIYKSSNKNYYPEMDLLYADNQLFSYSKWAL